MSGECILYVRIPDASTSLGHRDMWISYCEEQEGLDAIKQPSEEVLRVMKSVGAVFKLSDANDRPIAFSRLMPRGKITWITNKEIHGKMEQFGKNDGLFSGMSIRDKRTKKFYNNFLKSWNTLDDAEVMLGFCEISSIPRIRERVRDVCYRILEIAINSRKDDFTNHAINMNHLSRLKSVLEGKTKEQDFDRYLVSNQNVKIGTGWVGIYTCFSNFFNSTSIVPTQCILFFIKNEMNGLGSGRIYAEDMADMVRDAITPLEAIDEYVVPSEV